MNITNTKLEKADEINVVICLVPMFLVSRLRSLNYLKKVYILQFCANLRKKPKSIYINASERSRYALPENGIVYYAITYCLGYISI